MPLEDQALFPRTPRRREFLRAGLAAFGALSLPSLFQLRAEASLPEVRERTAVSPAPHLVVLCWP